MPGYFPESAFANGKPLADNRRFNRAIKGQPVHKMLTRVGFDGSIRQTLLPVAAHDVEVAPDRSIGVLCSMDGEQHTAFDPETLELAAIGPSLGDGWHGGGHAVYLDGGRTVILSERAPSTPYQGKLERHYGRLTVRDPKTLKIAETYSTHGIDPHDIRLTADGKYIVAANYGSTISAKTGKFTIPRGVVQASITVVEVSSGKLVDKRVTGKGEVELRHLAAGRLDRIFAIQARYGSDHDDARQLRGENVAYESDITTDPGYNYMAAATLKYDAARNRLTKMGDAKSTKLMRHGLSIRYDERHDEAIATYPTTHHVMVFDGATGAVSKQPRHAHGRPALSRRRDLPARRQALRRHRPLGEHVRVRARHAPAGAGTLPLPAVLRPQPYHGGLSDKRKRRPKAPFERSAVEDRQALTGPFFSLASE